MERRPLCLQAGHLGLAWQTCMQCCSNRSLHHLHPVLLIRLVERVLRCQCTRPPVLCPRMQRFLRVIQAGLHLIQLDASALSLLYLSARFEELFAQTLVELEGLFAQTLVELSLSTLAER